MKKLNYARTIGLSIIFIFAISCSGGGGGGGGDDNSGTAPVIDSVTLFRIIDGVPIERLVFDIGDEINLNIFATDPDMDIDTLFVSQYLFPNTDIPYSPVLEFLLPSQIEPSIRYFLLSNTVIEGPAGDWRICFYVVDEAGNESNDVCLNVLIMESDDIAQGNSGNLSLSLISQDALGFANKIIDADD